MWSELGVYDEYGNTITESETQHTGALPYGWLGGKERATDVSGLMLMGVRLYNSVTGQFTSVDPIVGGNSTAYAYPQDPINHYDLDGRWGRRNALKNRLIRGVVTSLAIGLACGATAGVACALAGGALIGGSLGAANYWANTKKRTGWGWARAIGGGAASGAINGAVGAASARFIFSQQVKYGYKNIKMTRDGLKVSGRHAVVKQRGHVGKGKTLLHTVKHYGYFRW